MASSRKDYRAMARVIREQWEAEHEAGKLTHNIDGQLAIEALAFRVADMYAADNPHFRRELFLRAALPEPQAVTT